MSVAWTCAASPFSASAGSQPCGGGPSCHAGRAAAAPPLLSRFLVCQNEVSLSKLPQQARGNLHRSRK
eukprot:5973140-Amphidinium_carterae.1